ncbi:DUF5710 domain-containing protein [Limnohabitans sp.]|uniref:DUF5710 domain-containing protein n=1 Tax=Limnohabitans sp. TaxID=1907725 RepID=UPI00286F2B3F|nr:DUF5710 domain-containing protein [Limnohabitans sp.]
MRINLVTPFAEKDAAKALGARWDATKKCWYIVDMDDLKPFMRWIPNLDAAQDTGGTTGTSPKAAVVKTKPPVASKPALVVPHCGCQVLPWEDCEHSLVKRLT